MSAVVTLKFQSYLSPSTRNANTITLKQARELVALQSACAYTIVGSARKRFEEQREKYIQFKKFIPFDATFVRRHVRTKP